VSPTSNEELPDWNLTETDELIDDAGSDTEFLRELINIHVTIHGGLKCF
jgi:hypothetical protein